ncbi:hypothetical protein LQ567_25000 [Niabella pedocola]|uniref:Uncharacterized protein n=1 Tax=Niabella pedocola TaxID=1752077 RepID=A0ABS8Q1I3_9BACT|nr:hypothetical protein [Niabella pedocola]MCD2426066.1 hypothetical protein [Niabella pedocola]
MEQEIEFLKMRLYIMEAVQAMHMDEMEKFKAAVENISIEESRKDYEDVRDKIITDTELRFYR